MMAIALTLVGCGAEAASVCPTDEPAQDEVTATPLPGTEDVDNWHSRTDSLGNCQSERMFRFHARDTGIGFDKRNDATVELKTKNLHLCVFAACDVGATHVQHCIVETTDPVFAESALGTRGCCTSQPDTVTVDYYCQDAVSSLVSDDSANIFVQVCPTKAITEKAFAFRYHF